MGQPHQPIREAIQSHFEFGSATELHTHLTALELEVALPYFADFLHLPFECTDAKFNRLTAEQIHYRTLQYLRDWLVQLTDLSPVVWVVEDTHWLDDASSKLLQYLCQTVEHSPVLFLFSRRSGYEQVAEAAHGIELEKQVEQRYSPVFRRMDVKPLSQEVSHSLLSYFLGGRKLLPSDFNRVLESAAGNPLYLREVAQFMAVSPNMEEVPPSVERLILAHIDLLPAVHQSLLRYGAVLGSRVEVRMWQSAFPGMDVMDNLHQLAQIGWLQPESGTELSPPLSVQWRHDLYRETLYNSIEPNTRRQLHAEIAEQLEAISETPPDVLAEHYEAAGVAEKSAHYACCAARMYEQRWQFRRVEHYTTIALSHSEHLSCADYFDICCQRANALMETGRPSEAIPFLELALSLAITNDYHIHVNMELAHCYAQRISRERAVACRDRALSLIDASTETRVIVAVCRRCLNPRGVPVPDVLSRILQLVRERGDKEAEAWVLCDLASAQAAAGDVSEAHASLRETIQLAEALGDTELIADLAYRGAYFLWKHGRLPVAVDYVQRALRCWEQTDSQKAAQAQQFLGDIYHQLGQNDAMIQAYEKVLEQEELLDMWLFGMNTFAHLVQGYAQRGDWEQAYRYFWRMLDNMRSQPPEQITFEMENAVAGLCHGDKMNSRWMWEGVPQTMERAQELIAQLYERGITPGEMKRLQLVPPILAAAYVQYGAERTLEEGVEMIRLFARAVYSLDEYVAYWEYLTEKIDRDVLEAIFRDALKQTRNLDGTVALKVAGRGEIPVSETEKLEKATAIANSEKAILAWLYASFRERYEDEEAGIHLMLLGFIPEPCWVVTGPFEGERLSAEAERQLLTSPPAPLLQGEGSSACLSTCAGEQSQVWRRVLRTDDFIDGYLDYVRILQTIDRVCAYAWTTIISPKEQQVQFHIGYDDNVSVWLNGELRFETRGQSPVIIDDEQFDGLLQPGRNYLVVRVANIEPGWGFIVRVIGGDGKVVEEVRYEVP